MGVFYSMIGCIAVSLSLSALGCKQSADSASKANPSLPALKSSPQATAQPTAKTDTKRAPTPPTKRATQPSASTTSPAPSAVSKPAPQSPKATETECRKACENVLKISLKDIDNASAEFKQTLEKTVRIDCPKQCRKHGTRASVKCLMEAKTASAMTACPH